LLVSAEQRELQKLPGILTSDWTRCPWSESYCDAESQQKLLGEQDPSHTSRQSSFSASKSRVALYALYVKADKMPKPMSLMEVFIAE